MNKHIRFAIMNTLTGEFVAQGASLNSFTTDLFEAKLVKTNTEAELMRNDVIRANDQFDARILETVRIWPDIRRTVRGRPSKK